MNNYNNLLRFIQKILSQSIHKEVADFSENQESVVCTREGGADLVIADNLEEIYGNHENPSEKHIELDSLRQNIMNHFKKVYKNGGLRFLGTSKINCSKTSSG